MVDLKTIGENISLVEKIIEIDYLSYVNDFPEYRKREYEDVRSYIEKNPTGCFVAKDGANAVAFLLSRNWGSICWLGPLSVLPDYTGQGIARMLLTMAMNHYSSSKCRMLGFEAQPVKALYLKLGMIAVSMTYIVKLDLTGKVEHKIQTPIRFEKIIPGESQKIIWEICDKTYEGLQLYNELFYNEKVFNNLTYLIIYKNVPCGILAFEIKNNSLIIKHLIYIRTDQISLYDIILQAADLSKSYEKKIIIPINSIYMEELRNFIKNGAEIVTFTHRYQNIYSQTTDNNKNIIINFWGT